MVRSGKRNGAIGVTIGSMLLAIVGIRYLGYRSRLAEFEERRQSSHAEMEEREEQDRTGVLAFRWLLSNVLRFTRLEGEDAFEPLPDAGIARRLQVCLGDFPDSAAARLLTEYDPRVRMEIDSDSEREPWITWRRILRETRAGDAEAALPGAVAALIEAVSNEREPRAAQAAIRALGEIGAPGANEAIPALEAARDAGDHDLRHAAILALSKLRPQGGR